MGKVVKQEELNGAGAQSFGYGFTEAPASVNVKLSYHGYDVMLTLRDATGTGVLERLDAALAHLEKRGIRPAGIPANGPAQSEAPMCPDGHGPMKPSKYGGHYCPAAVGEHPQTHEKLYCRHKVK